jgi:sugar-specific transcriptional regulator TrmB
MDELLRSQGLTSHEIKIYKMLLEHGDSLAGNISQQTGIHRRNVYDALERLIQKGLVVYIKQNNRKVYTITNPERILRRLSQEKNDWEALLPTMMAKFNAASEKKETLFFRGNAGVKMVLEDQIQVGKEVLVNATTSSVTQILKYFFPKYHLLRKEKEIKTRMLFDKDYATKLNKAKLAELPLCRCRFIENFNKSPMSQYIYGDNVAIIVWSDEPIAILIREAAVAQGFRDNFLLLWTISNNKQQR